MKRDDKYSIPSGTNIWRPDEVRRRFTVILGMRLRPWTF